MVLFDMGRELVEWLLRLAVDEMHFWVCRHGTRHESQWGRRGVSMTAPPGAEKL